MAIPGRMDATEVSSTETSNLIGSDKVEGTAVYSLDGDNIGTIQRVMIDKVKGNVAYAVMSFGGFLGVGEDYYPLPWSKLHYNENLGGYEVDVSQAQLEGAPHYRNEAEYNWSDREQAKRVYDYYGVSPAQA